MECPKCGSKWKVVPPPLWLITLPVITPLYCPNCGAEVMKAPTTGWALIPAESDAPSSPLTREILCPKCGAKFRVSELPSKPKTTFSCPFCGQPLGLISEGASLEVLKSPETPSSPSPTPPQPEPSPHPLTIPVPWLVLAGVLVFGAFLLVLILKRR